MQTIVMPVRLALTQESVLEALALVREKEGVKAVKFIELFFAPSYSELFVARAIADDLMIGGFGIKLSVDWAFNGTTRWAVQTENTRVANEGLALGR